MLVRLVNTSISAGWLILAIMALRVLCRRLPRSIVCASWALVAVRLLCPFSIRSPLSVLPSGQTIPVSALNAVSAARSVTLDVVVNPFYPDPVQTPTGFPARSIQALNTYGTYVWLAGLGILAVYGLFSYLRLRRAVRVSLRLQDNAYLCDWVRSPFILGLARPRIYLPSAMDPDYVPYVLAHERAHLKRHDHWWKALGFALTAVYWFDPLVWAAYALLGRDIELACDERAVRDMDGSEKKRYSEILLACGTAGPGALVSPLTFGEVGVKARIKAVLRYKKPARWAAGLGAALGLVLAVCFLTDPQADYTDVAAVPSPTPIVHRMGVGDIAVPGGYGDPETGSAAGDGRGYTVQDEFPSARTGSLPSLIYCNGQLYGAVDPYSFGLVWGDMRSSPVLGRIESVVSRDRLPEREWQTNDSRLAGLEVQGGRDCLYVALADHEIFYEPYDPGLEDRIAAMLSDEESFAAGLAAQQTADGATEALTYEEYAARFGFDLVSPAAGIPDGFKNSGYVFVRTEFVHTDPGGSDQVTSVCQLLYDFDRQAALTLYQYPNATVWEYPRFYYTDTDELGRPLRDLGWFTHQAVYAGFMGTTQVHLSLRSAQDLGQVYCRDLLAAVAGVESDVLGGY